MIVEDDSTELKSFFNLEAFQKFISLYKFPLILAGIGLIFLLVGIAFAVKTQYVSQEVVFSEATSSAKVKIQVDVEGAVMAPGVYEVEEGSRITAALAAAGGLSAAADRNWIAKNMNLAAKVVDGGKIYIPSLVSTSEGKAQNSIRQLADKTQNLGNSSNLLGVTAGKVNINTASQPQLEALPGIGPVTAGKIISGRPYQTVEELKSKKVVGKAVFEKIKDLITVY